MHKRALLTLVLNYSLHLFQNPATTSAQRVKPVCIPPGDWCNTFNIPMVSKSTSKVPQTVKPATTTVLVARVVLHLAAHLGALPHHQV